MDNLDIYVYECPNCENETRFDSESVTDPEVHLHQTEFVYCDDCGEDKEMIFKGCEGFFPGGFVKTPEGDRYCPLCEGNCILN